MKRRRAGAAGRPDQPQPGRHSTEYIARQTRSWPECQPNYDGIYPVGQAGRAAVNDVEERGDNDRYGSKGAAA